ncbi:CYFA0S16e02366g1_1 [Cyberlindnera fabianii]|uniref:CYFA0S16e02366g1_1 n=1 Tax=Cyberlindnera fabianii TaxID=36022 RepID=A0A061B5N8_CYBFA|nr:CYFA0S16e02366g1_1 [Cyberlindnera fabianii]
MPHPYELVLNFRSKVPKSQQPQRSRSGCFNCRKLKKKCSEERPSCKSCQTKCIPCVWPSSHAKSMPKDYKIPPQDPILVTRKREAMHAIKKILPKATTLEEITKVQEAKLEACELELPSTPTTIKKDPETPDYRALDLHSAGRVQPLDELGLLLNDTASINWDQSPFQQHQQDTTNIDNENDPVSLSAIDNYEDQLPLWIPISTSRKETFITACAVGLISALAPQYTHPLLHASSTWTPFVKMNPIIERVTEASGCSFIAWEKPDLIPLAEKKYDLAFNELFGYIRTHELETKDHLWLGAAFQLLAVGSKTVWTFRDKRRIDNLKGSWKLIKARIAQTESSTSTSTSPISSLGISNISPSSSTSSKDDNSPESPPRGNFDDSTVASDYSNENLKMEVENSLLRNEYKDDLASRFERGWIEAFIYQYGMLLLIDDVDVMGLPTPFEVFSLVRKRIKRPLMNCDIAWMNHPVFGASFDAFELACKASYLMRHLDHEMTFMAAHKLYDVVQSYQLPQIPAEVVNNPESFNRNRDSALMSEVMLRAVKILLRKIINLRLDETDIVIQRDLEAALHKLTQITRCGQVMGISSWPLFILGLTAIKDEHRDVIIEGCMQYGEVCQARYIYTLIDTLKIAWGMRGDTYTTARGLNILLETEILDRLIL